MTSQTPNFFGLVRFLVGKLFVVFLDELLVALRNFLFLSRSDVFLRQKNLKFTAQFQFQRSESVDLLRQLVELARISSVASVRETSDIAGNAIDIGNELTAPAAQLLTDVLNLAQPFFPLTRPLTRIVVAVATSVVSAIRIELT